MPVVGVLSATEVLRAFVLGLRHRVRLLRSSPAQVQETLQITLNQTTILIVGFLTCPGAILLVSSPTLFTANIMSATVILYLAALQSKVHTFRGALFELPFLFLSLLVLSLGYPFKHQL